MPLTPRFTAIDKAVLVATGNSFVVCGSTTEVAINTSDMIKPDGSTTRDWSEAGSTANLNILSNSTILYAELLWYSTVKSNVEGSDDLRSIQDDPITFTTPKGSYQISPEYTDTNTGESGTIDRYRAANVTSYIQDSLSGNYTVSNVPISIPETGLSNTRAGWTLSVIYRNDSLPPQKVIYQSGISVAKPGAPLQSAISGFTTSSDISKLKGYVFLACANGEPLNGDDFAYAGPSFAQLSNIGNTVNSPNPNPGTSPNNPGNSFFSGLINIVNPLNINNGLINISGTNGSNNHDGFVPIQKLGARNKWDITNVDITKTIVPNQTLLAGQVNSSVIGDGVQLVAVASQVNVNAPNMTATLDAYDIDGDGEYKVEVGEELVYSLSVKNSGSVDASNVIVSANIDSSTTFIPGSVTINEVSYPTADISSGINLGTIPAHGIKNVLFTVRVNSVPVGGLLKQAANYNYQFISGIDTITNYVKTNTVELTVQDGVLSISKTSSKSTAVIGDTITYTINIENIGTEIGKNIFLQDKIDKNCSFVDGSVIIDGVEHSEYNPIDGIYLPDLDVEESTQIVFQCEVKSLPVSEKVYNNAYVSFGYIFNEYGYLREKTISSNITSTIIQYINVIAERCNNNNYPKAGDTVTYTLRLTNTGNVDATNVQVLEPTITGASFIDGSVKINGIIEPTLNPFDGFILPEAIGPKAITEVEYKVLINEVNPESLIENIAQVPFKYQISSETGDVQSEKDSNKVDTMTNYTCMNIIESVDKDYAIINDILYYTVKITNNGNLKSTDTVFLSSIQQESTFIAGSVTINGISYPNYNPNQGFTLGTICSKATVEVTFQAKVNSVPSPNIIYNQSDLVYSYQPDPDGNILTNTIYSNIVETIIKQASYTVTKSVDKMYAQVGDYLVYTTVIKNTGNVDLTNMKFADFTGLYLDFYEGSLYINGINYPNYNPSTQFPLDDLHPEDTTTIVFGATIVENSPVGYIPNTSEVTLSYKQTPYSTLITKTVYSNTVKTYDPYVQVDVVKNVDKSYALVGDTLTYSFTVTNNGNTSAKNAIFSDTIQSQASFIAGSVYINGVNKPSYNPNDGFNLDTINIGQVINIEFKVKVDSLPSPNNIKNSATISYQYYIDPNQQPISNTATSNIVTTIINAYSANLTKSVNKSYAMVGDILNYEIIASNTGTVPLTNVNLKDIIPNGSTFVDGSVFVDGVNIPVANPNIGFTINDVLPGGNVVVTFKATVTSIPNPPQINNSANINFKYRLSPTLPYVDATLNSNTVTTNVVTVNITNTKSVDKTYATVGDVLTYTSVITNNSNVNITDTIFTDLVPNDTSFVSGSVSIGGTPYPDYNPNTGFTLNTIAPGASVTVKFDVNVDSVPHDGYVTNISNINYSYKLDPNGSSTVANKASNSVTTYIRLGNLTVTKASDRTVVRLNNVITYSFVISNTGNTILKNLKFTDSIQEESLFNTGSVYVNGVNKPTYDPEVGFNLDDIDIGNQATVTFTVTVDQIPLDNQLLNKSTIDYSYYVDPNGSPTTKSKDSNTTTVYVYDTIMSATKSVDKDIAKVGDALTFTIDIVNEGNVAAEFVNFIDALDSNLAFIEDSVYVNGQQKIGYNPNEGFVLSNIEPDTTTTVTFQATVDSRPLDNTIYNFATINYKYTVGTDLINATINTNTTMTFVAVGELTLTKSVNTNYATVGDNLTYSVTVKNTGSVNATNLTFTDLIPNATSFNEGTVVVDGISQPTFNPNEGFVLSDLIPNNYHTVTFSIMVDSLPLTGKVENTADVEFTYKLTPSDDPVTITSTSNKVTTFINLGLLNSNKTVDKLYATINDILTYTINIENEGNATCSSILFKDLIQTDATFEAGSVYVNGINKPDYNPNVGFNLEDIIGYGNTSVSFKVKVNSVPATDYILYNNSSVNYNFKIDPDKTPVSKQSTSNIVSTVINVGSLSATKSVSKSYATIGDVLTYTINILNNGNVTAKNINFRDVIPTGLTFVTDSVTINDVSKPGYNPYSSFSLGDIIAGDTVVVKFDVTVSSLPSPSLVSNTANLTFMYRIDPDGTDIYGQTNSNTVTTQINVGSLNILKSVNKGYATTGDIITYTVTLTNNGNVNATDVIFTDSLQSDVTFNVGSVKINGITYEDYNPNDGFNLGEMDPLEVVTVVFTATVIQQPTHDSVLNYAVGSFNYKVNPTGQNYSKSINSNTVYTIIIYPKLSMSKTVNKIYATLQDTLTYNILVKNEGNTTISSLVFADILSNGAIFKTGTVKIDGVSYPTYDPIIGFNLPTNLIAGNTSLVQFNATVNSLPTPPQVTNYATSNGVYKVDPQGSDYPISSTSNTVTTNVNVGSLSNIKSVDKLYAKVNDIVTYTSTITNTGNVNATNLRFTDLLQTELSYVSGTVRINNVLYPALDPISGFNLSDLGANQTVTITFDAKINALPTPSYVSNTSQIQFSYKVDPSGSTSTKTQTSNEVTTNVVLGKITAVKIVDKAIATIGDTLNYTITLTNIGNVINTEVLFQDTPSAGAQFKSGSVIVNGVSQPTYDPTVGFSIGDIGIGNVVIVQFSAIVVSVPESNKVTNQAVIPFKYLVDPKQSPYSDTAYSNTVTTNIAYGNLNVTKSVNKKYATIGEKITYTIAIENIGNINATDVVFLDYTPNNSIFVLGSVTVNGIVHTDYNPSAGFNLGTMVPGQIITVVYQVQVVDLC
ncbi:hypothetical protein [Paraclostridium sp. AKS73]|uniref:hypothetical protein n=1 Tax=Paraclostridium sp. AKS73 TaxID=2876116 RepID=UPI0021DFD61B|nr:hypothetical protein [Paraclostridium sp. AKS73]MCU9814245.1 DUF11 domain-containing protein [Paraclostridium sp. AKS73]